MSRRLHYKCGHSNFIGYPKRWFSTINDTVNELLVGCNYSKLKDIVSNIILEAEHLPTFIIGHMIAILIYSSYQASLEGFCQFTEFPLKLNKVLIFKEECKWNDNYAYNHFLNLLRSSDYFVESKYLQYTISIISLLIKDDIEKCEKMCSKVMKWRFGCSFEQVIKSNLTLTKSIIHKSKFNCSLSILYQMLNSEILAIKQLALWNISFILHLTEKTNKYIEILELCEQTFSLESNIDLNNVLVSSNYVTLTGIHQQLVIAHSKTQKVSFIKRYCMLLQEHLQKALVPQNCKFISVIAHNDISYLINDDTMHQNIMNELQSFEVEGILNESSPEARNLALSSVLLTQAFKCLYNGLIQQAYENYYQSNCLLDKNYQGYSDEYSLLEKRLLAQLYSLEGYFRVLEGKKEDAAISYMKSFCHDKVLIPSLFNHCILLIESGKIKEAKRSWQLVSTDFYKKDHQFSSLSLYLLKL